MAGTAIIRPECFCIPPDVEFQRWQSGSEWVLYHAGTGETMRLSEAAIAVLDVVAQSGPLDKSHIAHVLNAMMDSPMAEAEMQDATAKLLRVLLNHECIEQVPCG